MKKFVQFVFTTIFYFLAYGAIHETYDQNLSLLRPCTKEDYLWLIFSFILMSILIYKRTYSTNTLSEKEPSSETERKIVMFIITIMLATSIYFFASAVKILLGFGDNLLHPFSQNPPTESIIVALLSFLLAYVYLRKDKQN